MKKLFFVCFFFLFVHIALILTTISPNCFGIRPIFNHLVSKVSFENGFLVGFSTCTQVKYRKSLCTDQGNLPCPI